jgi:DNA-binding IclR family transcriptional regulator
MTPIAIFHEQLPPMDMTRDSIRQLLGVMEKAGLVTKDEHHAYFLKAAMSSAEIVSFNEAALLAIIERACETFRTHRKMPTTSIQRVLKKSSENEAVRNKK